jgi:hypothetical protein
MEFKVLKKINYSMICLFFFISFVFMFIGIRKHLNDLEIKEKCKDFCKRFGLRTDRVEFKRRFGIVCVCYKLSTPKYRTEIKFFNKEQFRQ